MSSENFIKRSIVKRLGLSVKSENKEIVCHGLQDKPTILSKFAQLTLGECPNQISVEAYIVDHICSDVSFLPARTVAALAHGRPVPLVPEVGDVDVLLNASTSWKIVNSVRRLYINNNFLCILINTLLGPCVINGFEKATNAPVVLLANKDLERALARFYSLEMVGIKESPDDERSAEEVAAEQLLLANAYFENGAWVMPLLFKPEARALRNNYKIAEKRLRSLERKLSMDPPLKKLYRAELKALFERGDARFLSADEIPSEEAFYLPHRPVVRMDKESSKVRPVFDASAKNQDGISLNSEILQTPALHPPLTGILLRFRKNKIALTGDVSKMFLRMKLLPDHEKYQRFLLREDDEGPIKHAVITKMAFGLTDSPFKALRGVQLHVLKFKDKYPEAANELEHNLYVDDLLSGHETPDGAIQLQKQCVELMAKAGLPLRKWCSNSPQVMKAIPKEERGEVGHFLLTKNLQDEVETDGGERPTTSALGVEWDVESDQLRYTGFAKMNLPTEGCTKRAVVSAVASFFDPLGLISPFIISAKILIQSTWKREIGWDDVIPADLLQTWIQWVREVPNLGQIALPRCFQRRIGRTTRRHLVAFSDASEAAMGAAVYLRTTYEDGKSEVHLLMAKARVSPLKELTLPRKELAAAVITAKLLKHVAEEMRMEISEAICFSDSMTTLQWLRKPGRSWKQWVCNRVLQIQEITNSDQWRHVPGVDNPANLPSRGTTAWELVDNPKWFQGPTWLHQPESKWPNEPLANEVSEECRKEQKLPLMEEKVTALVTTKKERTTIDRLKEISGLRRLVRVTARIIKLARKISGDLTPDLENEALRFWLLNEQAVHFSSEIAQIKAYSHVGRSSRLWKLTPFIDEEGLLRMKGRLQASELTYDEKHPIILPALKVRTIGDINKTLTARLIYHAHCENQHAGADWLLRHLRERYWLVHGRNTVKSVIGRCVACQAAVGRLHQQRMAPHPEARVMTGTPWAYVGVDFTGAFNLKEASSKEVYKGYVLIFTNLVSRGVHFEITTGMDTNIFFDAFRRFISRRGVPKEMHSDEARNFVRAKVELLHLFKFLDPQDFKAGLAALKVKWVLNTPKAPFRGGSWERLLRNFKETLRKTVGGRLLSKEELVTVSCEIEAMINDRPLCVPTDGPDDAPAITPSLIMSGRLLRYLPKSGSVEDAPKKAVEMTRLWRERSRFADRAWKHFSQTYLKEVLSRTPKWGDVATSPIKEGQIVLLSTEDPHRGQWPRARVVAVHEGRRTRDGLIRTVTVQLPSGKRLHRPVQKLVKLELDYPNEEDVPSNPDNDSVRSDDDRGPRLATDSGESRPRSPEDDRAGL